MRISEVRLENFRGFEKEIIRFDNYSCLVGANGAGKSTILTALRIFFRDIADTVTDLQVLTEEDFHNKDVSKDIVITVVFSDLNDEAQQDLKHYYRHGQLVVSSVARWDAGTKRANVAQYGERRGIKLFGTLFEAEKEGKPASQLIQLYENFRVQYSDLPNAKTKPKIVEALQGFEGAHPELMELNRSGDQFYGFTRGENILQKYVQWVFVPAVKDASSENLEGKKNALRVLLERTVRSKVKFDTALKEIKSKAEEQYKSLLTDNQVALASLSSALTQRIQEWAHPEASLSVRWDDEASRYVSVSEPLARVLGKEAEFEGDLSRFGHGFQRSYLLALLQELASCPDSGQPNLILACEEPELHQHPPQARHLTSVLQALSLSNAQVIVATHSPLFVSGRGFEDIRLVRREQGKSTASVRGTSFQEISNSIAAVRGEQPHAHKGMALKVHQALQPHINEMFFTNVLILVEGIEDAAYVQTYITLMEKWDDFRRLGCHIIPAGGKSHMIQPLAIAKQLLIPTFVIFDSDRHRPDKNGSRRKHEIDNLAILRLCSVDNPVPFPDATLQLNDLVMWNSEIGPVVQEEIGGDHWRACEEEIRTQRGIDVDGLDKNYLFIGAVLTEAWNKNRRSEALERACTAILSFAASSRARSAAISRTQAGGLSGAQHQREAYNQQQRAEKEHESETEEYLHGSLVLQEALCGNKNARR